MSVVIVQSLNGDCFADRLTPTVDLSRGRLPAVNLLA